MGLSILPEGPLAVWTMPWSSPSAGALEILTAKVTLSIDPEAQPTGLSPTATPAVPRGESNPELDSGDDGYPSDFVPYKPRAEVLVCGTVHPKRGATTGHVGLRFGGRRPSIARDVAVVGERHWDHGVPSAPRRLKPFPMRYAYAFGGPGHPLNPAGRGYAGAGRTGGGPLPQLELASQLVQSPQDAAVPACLSGIPASWSRRWHKLGTFDRDWQNHRWPHLPSDFDPRFFQAAPPEQQLKHIEGNETFEITGMHPEHRRIAGELPGLVARAFLFEKDEPPRVVGLTLDTVVFEMDQLEVSLLFRGRLEVGREGTVVVVLAELGQDEASTIEQAAALTSPVVEPVAQAPDERALRLRRALDEARVPRPWFTAGLSPRRPVPSVEEIESQLRGDAPSKQLRPLLDALRTEAERAQRRRDWVVAQLDGPAEGQADFAGVDLRGADLSQLDLSGRSLTGADLSGARMTSVKLEGSDLSGARLVGADLSGAMAATARLVGADLTGACLSDADLSHSELARADLSQVEAARASFEGAKGQGSRWVEANLELARLEGADLEAADFSQARLRGATFTRAALVDVRLYDVTGQASFNDAELTGARANDARLEGSSFLQARAERSVWDGAQLRGCDLRRAQLSGACFNDANMVEVKLASAVLRGSQLRRADLTGAVMLQTDLMEAILEAACLDAADLRGANLAGAETWQASLNRTRLEKAVVHRTKLAERS